MDNPKNHKVLDLLVLFLMHGNATYRKSVESTLKRKIKQGHFTTALLEKTISDAHQQVPASPEKMQRSPSILSSDPLLMHPGFPVCLMSKLCIRLSPVALPPTPHHCMRAVIARALALAAYTHQYILQATLDTLAPNKLRHSLY